MIKLIVSSLIVSSLISAQEPSAFNAGGVLPQKTELQVLNERLFQLSTQVKNIEESQEGLKSVFEGQLQRVQDVASRIELLKGENNATIAGIINNTDSNFSLQNENIEKIKQSISALGALIKKTNAQMQTEINELKDRLVVLERSQIAAIDAIKNETGSEVKDAKEARSPEIFSHAKVKDPLGAYGNLAADTLIGNVENNATQTLELVDAKNLLSSENEVEQSVELDARDKMESRNISKDDKKVKQVPPKILENVESTSINSKNNIPKQEDSKIDDFKKKSLADIFKEGEQLYKNKDYGRADEYLQFAVKGNYKPARGNYLLGEIAFEQRRYEDAIYYYKISATRYDKAEYMPRLMLHSAKSFIELKEEENAKRFLETLVTLYPKSSEASEAKKLVK